METLSIIVLIMLCMVGYSSGITSAARGKNVPPALVDLILLLVIWTIALRTRPQVLEWLGGSRILLLIVWLMIGLLVGFVKTKLVHSGQLDRLPDTELPEHAQVKEVVSGNVFRRLWEGWKVFAAEMGHIQGALFMGFFYFIIVTVFGLGTRIFTDPMRLKTIPTASGWANRIPLDSTIEQAREQGQTD